ncbi:Leucine-rich repeat and WD repeat-containing protein 1 [Halotydeus destructor]|nr:Leucine-rich repeat and WD repeat-containing protein 1 [Halotydeus destructor]
MSKSDAGDSVNLTQTDVSIAIGDVLPGDVKHLDLSGRKLSGIDEDAFVGLTNVESIKLSDNRLRSIGSEFQILNNLKKLELQDNCLQKPVLYLSLLPPISELNMSGNPLKESDKMLATELIPTLQILENKKCSQTKETIKKMKAQIDSKLELIWLNNRFSEQVREASRSNNDVSEKIIRECVRKIKAELKFGQVWQTVLQFLVDGKVKEKVDQEQNRAAVGKQRKFGQETISSANVNEEDSENNCAKVKQSPKRKTKGAISQPKKKKVDGIVDYEATLFIRCHCHQNNPLDSSTQIWKAAFKPKLDSNPDEHATVATCGGNIVCLIDCDEAVVKQRYTDSDIGENFYALAWTVLTENGSEDAVLAVAGLTKSIILISTRDFSCYHKFKAHDKDINALLFHPTRTHWLFSGSYDHYIKIWNIQRSSLKDMDYAPLIKVDTKNELLTFCFSIEYNCLLAGGENGLTVWHNVNTSAEQGTFGQIVFDSSNPEVIDGVAIIPENPNYILVKQSRTGKVSISSLPELLADLSKSNTRSKLNSFRQASLNTHISLDYALTRNDYIYPAIQAGLMVCGDDEGSIWLYDTSKMHFNAQENVPSSSDVSPLAVYAWPEISNPKLKQRKVVDETKQVFINCMALSSDLNYMVAATNINLVCIWKRV